MDMDYYQGAAMRTAIYPKEQAIVYTTLGLVSEAGEIAGKVKKVIRDNDGVYSADTKKALEAEVGDVLWYVAAVCEALEISMADVASANLKKLADRQNRGVISGCGDNR